MCTGLPIRPTTQFVLYLFVCFCLSLPVSVSVPLYLSLSLYEVVPGVYWAAYKAYTLLTLNCVMYVGTLNSGLAKSFLYYQIGLSKFEEISKCNVNYHSQCKKNFLLHPPKKMAVLIIGNPSQRILK